MASQYLACPCKGCILMSITAAVLYRVKRRNPTNGRSALFILISDHPLTGFPQCPTPHHKSSSSTFALRTSQTSSSAHSANPTTNKPSHIPPFPSLKPLTARRTNHHGLNHRASREPTQQKGSNPLVYLQRSPRSIRKYPAESP